MTVRILAAAVLLVTSTAGAADPKSDPYRAIRDQAARMVGAIMQGNALEQLQDLGDSVGGRLTGSASYTKAAAWGAAQLRAAGVQNVHFENFTMEHGWERGAARARVVGPGSRVLHVESHGWAPATPAGGVRGQLVVFKSWDPAVLAPLLGTVKGKILILDRSEGYTADGARPWIAMRQSLAAFKTAGAVAVLWPMVPSVPNNVLSTGSPEGAGKIMGLPSATVGYEDGQYLLRSLESGPVTVELELANKVTGPVQVPNVVGELKGTERPNEWLLIGGHLDSWDFATGTQDNGAGVIGVVQAARALAAAGPLKRSVRFALWGGEEQFLVGSHAYAVAHEAELASCVVTLNTDNGAGHVQGWKVEGRKDVKAALAPLAKKLLTGLGGATVDMTFTADTDHFSFLVTGVPSLDLLVDLKDYDVIHHKAADTIDKVDAHNLVSGVAVVAVTAYAIAMTTEPFAPRLDRAAMTELFKPGSYDALLKLMGWWQ